MVFGVVLTPACLCAYVSGSECECLEAGSLNNEPECRPETGMCTCKENVEGQNCDQYVHTRLDSVSPAFIF